MKVNDEDDNSEMDQEIFLEDFGKLVVNPDKDKIPAFVVLVKITK